MITSLSRPILISYTWHHPSPRDDRRYPKPVPHSAAQRDARVKPIPRRTRVVNRVETSRHPPRFPSSIPYTLLTRERMVGTQLPSVNAGLFRAVLHRTRVPLAEATAIHGLGHAAVPPRLATVTQAEGMDPELRRAIGVESGILALLATSVDGAPVLRAGVRSRDLRVSLLQAVAHPTRVLVAAASAFHRPVGASRMVPCARRRRICRGDLSDVPTQEADDGGPTHAVRNTL
jgi:hypothetical protein